MNLVHVRLLWSAASGFALWIAAVVPGGGWLACVAMVPVMRSMRQSHNCVEAAGLAVVFASAWAFLKMEWLAAMGCRGDNRSLFFIGWCLVMLVLIASHAFGVTACYWLCRRRGWLCSAALSTSWLMAELLADCLLRIVLGLTLDPLRIATTQLNGSPLVQCADWGGVPLVGWLVALANGLVIDLIWTDDSTVRSARTQNANRVFCGLLFWAFLYGGVRPWTSLVDRGPTVWLMPDVWRSSITELAMPLGEADFCIWPETSISGVLGADEQLEDQLRSAARETQTTIIIGCQRFGDTPAGLYNSACLIPPDGRELKTSDKHFLGPATEYAPPLARWFGVPDPSPGYSSGRPVCWTMPDGLRIGAGICHDASFPEWSRGMTTGGADLLVLLASEGFSESPQLKHQLLACSRLRAIESRRTLLRCANDGITAVIDGTGRVVTRTHDWSSHEPLVAGRVPLTTGVSLYHRCGNTVTIILVTCVAILAEICRSIPTPSNLEGVLKKGNA